MWGVDGRLEAAFVTGDLNWDDERKRSNSVGADRPLLGVVNGLVSDGDSNGADGADGGEKEKLMFILLLSFRSRSVPVSFNDSSKLMFGNNSSETWSISIFAMTYSASSSVSTVALTLVSTV